MGSRIERLSKYLSYILRHNPSSVKLALDENGFMQLDHLISAIQTEDKWSWVTRSDIMKVQRKSDKNRFEIVGNKIRAVYGHSLPARVQHEVVVPPVILYHGTARRSLQSILRNGILPMRRQYVHLSTSVEEAYYVGLRKDYDTLILRVLALKAHEAGVKFYQAGSVFLSEPIPSRFIELESSARK